MICHAFQAYGWFGVPAGKMTLTLDTIPAGYAFGWAEIQVDGKAGRGTVNTATASVTLRAHPHISSVYLRLITIVP